MSAPAPPPDRPASRRRSVLRIPTVVRKVEGEATIDLKRAVPAAVVAILSFAVGQRLGGIDRTTSGTFAIFGNTFHVSGGHVAVVVLILTVVFALTGIIATRSVGRELARVIGARGGPEAGNAVRLICFIVGYGLVLLGVLALLNVDLRTLLVGGAVTGVVIGIAAQQTLGNFFAGLVLLFARPYVPGERVKIRTSSMGGPFEGVIIGSGLMYTTIDTDEGVVKMPNAGLLAAAVGPATPPETPPADANDEQL